MRCRRARPGLEARPRRRLFRRHHRIFPDEIRDHAAELVMVIQGSTLAELARADCPGGATAIWSLWPGYLDRLSGRRTARLLEEHGVPLVHLHASGHARIKDLQALASANPASGRPYQGAEVYDSPMRGIYPPC